MMCATMTKCQELKKDAEDLTDFLDAIRRGKEVQADEVARLSRFFVDELTIDGAVRPQLVAMCKYMGLSPYGHDLFLRFKLRSRINAIKKDDMEIMWEGGPGSLTDEEVGKACRDRGIREGESMQVMRAQLADWLDLSQKKEIPSSLLILSRAFLYTRADGTVETGSESLVEALGSLPEDVIMDVKQAADVSDGTTVERLKESIRQAKLIAMESDAEARKEEEDEVRRKKKETEEEAEAIESQYQANGKTPFVPDDSISDREVMDTVQRQEKKLSEEVLGLDREVSDADMAARASVQSDGGQDVEPKDEEEVQKERDGIRRMLLSLGELASDSAVESEREELRSLKVELSEAETAVKGTGGEESADLRRFKSIVSKLEKEIERVDNKVGLRMKLLDQDNDGLMSLEECANVMGMIAGERDDALVAETMHRLDANSDGNISKADLERVLNEMQYEGALPESKQVPSTSNGAETLKTKQATD